MPRYEVGVRTTITTASVPITSLRAISNPVWLRELHLWYVTAPTTSGGLGLTRSTALGTGGIAAGVIGFPTNPSSHSPGTAEAVTAWTTLAPTFTAGAFFRRWFSGAATIGTGLIWTWEAPGLYLAGSASATSELVLVNLQATAAGTLDLTWVYEED